MRKKQPGPQRVMSDALASKLEAVIDYLEKKNPKRNVVLRMIYEEVTISLCNSKFLFASPSVRACHALR